MEKKREKERERENSTFTERYEKENVFNNSPFFSHQSC